MKKSLLFSLMTLSLVQAEYLGLNEGGVEMFTIDLDVPPRYRYKEVTEFKKEQALEVYRLYQDIIPASFHTAAETIGWLVRIQRPEFYEEVLGMADILKIPIN